MSVRGVLAEAHVGQHQQAGHAALDRAHGGLDRRARDRDDFEPMASLCSGQAEEQDAGDAVLPRGGGLLDGLVHRQLEDARHRGDRPPDVVALADEERVDQAVGREPRFANQRPNRFGGPQAPRASGERQARRRLRARVIARPAVAGDFMAVT